MTMLPLTIEHICKKPEGALVADVRERHGFTQKQCALIVGCSTRTWQRYETRDVSMDLGVWWCFLLRICEILPQDLPPLPPRQRAGVYVSVR